MRFEIICTGYNCREYVKKCIQSVIDQTYQNFHLHLISDGSTDGTSQEVKKYEGHPKISVHIHSENLGAALRRMQVIRSLNDESVCLLLGMDDELLPGCLERVKKEYDRGKWMTYGNWKDQYGRMLPDSFEFEFTDKEHEERSYRKLKYRSTAPNTFKKFLFNQIPDEDFKLNGKWIDTTTESELMFSCLEMCGKSRIGIIKEPIYMYNRNRKGGTLDRLGAEYKMKVLEQVMNRPKKPLLIREVEKEKILSVGLPVLANPFAWFAMEGLCGQTTRYKWELIIYEDSNDPNGEDFYKKYFDRLANCERIIYIYSEKRVSLSAKWRETLKYMHEDSLGLMLQASDCYSEPQRIKITYELLKSGCDWVHKKKGYFCNIQTKEMLLFNFRGCTTGLDMAISKEAMKYLPAEDKFIGVDNWLFVNASKKPDFKIGVSNSDTWYQGLDTDGYNRISLDRVKLYRKPVNPFEFTKTKLHDVLKYEILEKIYGKDIAVKRKPRVLNISSNDWANYSYYNLCSLKAAGVDVYGVKLMPHSFGYREAHPVVRKEEMQRLINTGGYDIIQVFNSDVTMLHFLRSYRGKVVVYHTGSSYRASSQRINAVFNPIIWKSVIALGEFDVLGAKDHNFVSVAVDTDRLVPKWNILKKPYKFLHCPSNDKVKGTDRILKMFAKAHLSVTVDRNIIPHEESWKRMCDCDIYVELFNPAINGDKYGSFGTTAAEAAALGKVVVTQNLSREVYQKHYGDSPLILAEDESDFIEKIKWLNRLPEEELLNLQKAHRDWAAQKHSFRATGNRIKQILEL